MTKAVCKEPAQTVFNPNKVNAYCAWNSAGNDQSACVLLVPDTNQSIDRDLRKYSDPINRIRSIHFQ